MNKYFDLTGKVAMVTGANSGLGASAAVAYAEAGAKVAVLARRLEKLEETKKKIEAVGGTAIAIRCDVSREEDVKKAVETIVREIWYNRYRIECGGYCSTWRRRCIGCRRMGQSMCNQFARTIPDCKICDSLYEREEL